MTTTDSFESSSEHPRLTIPIANSDYITPLRNYQRVAIEFPPSPSPLTRLQHEQQSERHRTAAQNLRHFGALPGSWDPTFAPPFTRPPRTLHRQIQMEQPSPQPLTQANVQSLERQAEAMPSAQSQIGRPASVRARSLLTPEQFSDAQLLAEAERLQQMVRNRQRAQHSIIKEESHEPEVEWVAPSETHSSGYALSALPPLPASTTSGNTPSPTHTQVDGNSLPKRDPYIEATSSQFNEYARQRVAAVVEAHEGQLRQLTHQNMLREYEEHLTRLAVQRQDMHGRTTYAIPPLAVNRFFAANMRHDGRLRSHPVDIRPELGPFIPNRNDYENNLINEEIIPDGLLAGESRSDYLRRQISQQAIDAMSSGVSHSGPLDEAHLQGIEGRLIRMAMLERLRLHDVVNVGRSNISEQGVLLTRDNRATHPNFPGIVVHIPDYVSQPDKYAEIRAWIPAPLREPPPDRDPSDGGDSSSHGGHGNGPPNRGPPRPPGGPGNPGGGPPNPPGGPPNGPPNPPGNSPPGSNHDAASNNSNRGNPPPTQPHVSFTGGGGGGDDPNPSRGAVECASDRNSNNPELTPGPMPFGSARYQSTGPNTSTTEEYFEYNPVSCSDSEVIRAMFGRYERVIQVALYPTQPFVDSNVQKAAMSGIAKPGRYSGESSIAKFDEFLFSAVNKP